MRSLHRVWLGIGILLLPVLAHSADGYVGGSIGRVEGDTGRNGWKAYIGTPLSTHYGMEVGYLELGGIDAVISSPAEAYPRTGSGLTLAATGVWPLAENGLQLLGRIGVFRWQESYTLGGTGSVSESGSDGFFGLGLQMPVKGVNARLDLERYRLHGETITMYSLGVVIPLKE